MTTPQGHPPGALAEENVPAGPPDTPHRAPRPDNDAPDSPETRHIAHRATAAAVPTYRRAQPATSPPAPNAGESHPCYGLPSNPHTPPHPGECAPCTPPPCRTTPPAAATHPKPEASLVPLPPTPPNTTHTQALPDTDAADTPLASHTAEPHEPSASLSLIQRLAGHN